MKGVYLYAMIDRPDIDLPAELGLDQAALVVLAHQDVAAVVSVLANVQAATEANLWRHEAIVEALMSEHGVLPVRFNTVLPDVTAVRSMLATHYSSFASDLARLRGRVELSLRVLCDQDHAEPAPAAVIQGETGASNPEANSGYAYMLARLEKERGSRARRQQAEAVAEDLHIHLGRLVVDSRQHLLGVPSTLLTVAYLVERDQVRLFSAEVETLRVVHPELHLVCTGPWPAYNFVTARISAPGEGD
jgi:hypothetical protein